jgi:hypothetical protein
MYIPYLLKNQEVVMHWFDLSLRVMATIMNGLLIVGIVYKFIDDSADLDNLRAVIWLAILLGCPVVNLLGLFKIWSRVTKFLAVIYNGISIFIWTFFIFLMMVWPMGSKPKGLALLAISISWLFLILTEVVLIRMIIHNKHRGPGLSP